MGTTQEEVRAVEITTCVKARCAQGGMRNVSRQNGCKGME